MTNSLTNSTGNNTANGTANSTANDRTSNTVYGRANPTVREADGAARDTGAGGVGPSTAAGPLAGARARGLAADRVGETVRGRGAVPPGRSRVPPPSVRRTLALPVLGPWSVRGSAGRGRRAALEVYEHGELLDVVVTSSLAGGVLRGVRRRPGTGHPGAFAWGRLCADGSPPAVVFTRGRRASQRVPAGLTTVMGAFWLAWCATPATGVLVSGPGCPPVRLRAGVAA